MYTLPLAYWTLGVRTAQMMFEAQSVVTFRLLGMAGGWPVSPTENTRMVIEKGPAFFRAYGAAATAAAKGKRIDQIAEAALKPISRKTRANAKRLSRSRR